MQRQVIELNIFDTHITNKRLMSNIYFNQFLLKTISKYKAGSQWKMDKRL